MPSDALLSYRLVGNTVVPHFLGEADHPWLRTLLEERERFVGRPQREVDARLRAPLIPEGPAGKKQLARETEAWKTWSGAVNLVLRTT